MKLSSVSPLIVAFLVASSVVACTTTTTEHTQAQPPATNPEGTAQTPPAVDPEDPANQPPHSLGSIVLGESHAAGSGTSAPIVSITFVPDALKAHACKTKLDESCEMTPRVKCTATKSSFNGCADGEACVLDDACASSCKKIAVCSKDCEEDEICTLDKLGKATCAKPETFDAGPIAFSGTTTPITMYPPYAYKSDGKGAPFLGGAEIKVQAQGAINAGFDKFDEAFSATTFIQASPTLNKIPREKVFGTGALPIVWKAGTDSILITLTGSGGSVTCKAKDADGKFDVPRTIVDKALFDETNTSNTGNEGTSSLSVSVTRQRKDTKKGHTAKGELTAIKVQPEAWVDLVTLSTESASFQGCAGKQSICGTGCADLQTDSENCGTCGNVCGSGTSCGGGTCVDPTKACNACFDATKTGACKTQFDACKADTSCNQLWTCVEACTTQTCQQTCLSQFPDGQAKAQTFATCGQNACQSACGN